VNGLRTENFEIGEIYGTKKTGNYRGRATDPPVGRAGDGRPSRLPVNNPLRQQVSSPQKNLGNIGGQLADKDRFIWAENAWDYKLGSNTKYFSTTP